MPLHVHPLCPQSQRGMHQHRTTHILLVEAPLQVRQNDHRKFQALGAVDAHDLHALRRASSGQSRRIALFQQPPQMGNKVEQPRLAALHQLAGVIEPLRLAAEGDQVFPALGAVVHGAENRHDAAPVIDVPQQLVHRHLPRRPAQLLQQRQKFTHRRPFVPAQRIVVVALQL